MTRRHPRVAAGGTRQGLILWRSPLRCRLRCDARPGVGVAELTARPEGRSVQTGATSQLTKRASAPAPRPSIAAATEIAPAGYRLPRGRHGGRASVERQPCLCKGVSGQAAAHRCEAPGFARFRGRALARFVQLTRRTCLNGAALGRAVSCATRPRSRAIPGKSVRSGDRLVDAPRPARTRLCACLTGVAQSLAQQRRAALQMAAHRGVALQADRLLVGLQCLRQRATA